MSPVELTQVLINLDRQRGAGGRGAWRAEQEVAVEARMQGDMLELKVRDEGVGMPPEVLKRVGTPWFTTRKEGTGPRHRELPAPGRQSPAGGCGSRASRASARP